MAALSGGVSTTVALLAVICPTQHRDPTTRTGLEAPGCCQESFGYTIELYCATVTVSLLHVTWNLSSSFPLRTISASLAHSPDTFPPIWSLPRSARHPLLPSSRGYVTPIGIDISSRSISLLRLGSNMPVACILSCSHKARSKDSTSSRHQSPGSHELSDSRFSSYH